MPRLRHALTWIVVILSGIASALVVIYPVPSDLRAHNVWLQTDASQ